MLLALSPNIAPVVPARLCLRGLPLLSPRSRERWNPLPDEPDPDAGITLTLREFLEPIARLREVEFPIERDPAEAWVDFVGWRVNYERPACAVALRRRRRARHSGPARGVARTRYCAYPSGAWPATPSDRVSFPAPAAR